MLTGDVIQTTLVWPFSIPLTFNSTSPPMEQMPGSEASGPTASSDPAVLGAENFLPRAQSLVSTAVIARLCAYGKGKELQCLDNEAAREEGWRKRLQFKLTSMKR